MSEHGAVFTAAGVRRGAMASVSLVAGVLVYGAVFGVLANGAGLSMTEAVLMSAAVYSGSAQLAVLQGWQAAPAILPVTLTVLIMNARYLLYGAALRPWLQGLRANQVYPSLFLLGDGNWTLSLAHHERGERDAGFLLGSGLAMFVAWVVGTVWGRLGGAMIPEPKALGLDVMLAAFCAAMAAAAWRGRQDIAPAAVATAAAVIAHQALLAGWAVVVAGLAGAVTASIRHDGSADRCADTA